MSKVFVTGLGITSCLGSGVAQHWAALKAGQSGIKQVSAFGAPIFIGANSQTNDVLKAQLAANFLVSRTALLGLQAAKEAWGLHENTLPSAFINASTVGGMDLSETFFRAQESERNLSQFLMHDLGAITNFMAKNIASFQYQTTISTACSSAANAIMLGSQLIASGQYHKILVGGTDALCEFTLQGFKSLMVYADGWCKPFDAQRTGLNLGEGAAYLVLESEKSVAHAKSTPLAIISGWANANDAFHSTGTSATGTGAQKSMLGALAQARLNAKSIDYINAHGTATQNNDSAEWAAMQAVFADKMPRFSSTKAFTGHTLGAAGAIEAVFSVLALQEQFGFANLNAQEFIDDTGSILAEGLHLKIDKVLSNSFGFGGNCTSLIFEKYA